jgi:hypothetical protein
VGGGLGGGVGGEDGGGEGGGGTSLVTTTDVCFFFPSAARNFNCVQQYARGCMIE